VEYPNIGSTFKNVRVETLPENWKKELVQYTKNDPFPVIPAAKLLFLANVKGKKIGGAQISDKHPNFIVNLGNATSNDVKSLIVFAKNEVWKKFNVKLEEEIMYLGGD
jgi:UDP-N-acetylmuramate dehydrogenase